MQQEEFFVDFSSFANLTCLLTHDTLATILLLHGSAMMML